MRLITMSDDRFWRVGEGDLPSAQDLQTGICELQKDDRGVEGVSWRKDDWKAMRACREGKSDKPSCDSV